jgi:thiol-disulfide isomerase/thioredoxin
MRLSTIMLVLVSILTVGGLLSAPVHASDLIVPPANYAYAPAADCPYAGVVYQACEDQMQRFASAFQAAKAEKKVLLVVIGADWCPWCRVLEKLLPTDQVLSRKDELFDFPARYAMVNIAESAITHGKKASVPSGEAVYALLLARAGKPRPRAIPHLMIVDPKSGQVVDLKSSEVVDPWNKDGGHDAGMIREALRAAYAKLRPAS